MDFHNYPLAPPAITYNLLKSLALAGLKCDKLQSSHLQQPAFNKSTIKPMTGKELKGIDSKHSMADANLTLCFATVKSRKAYQNRLTSHPDLRLPFSAANDEDHGA